MKSSAPTIPAWRWVLCLGSIGLWSALMLAVAARGGVLGALLAGPLFTVPLCSLGEWVVHGILYHGKLPGLGYIRRIHHAGHHFALFPPTHYVQERGFPYMNVRAPLTPFRMSRDRVENFLSKWGQISLHFVVGLPLIILPAHALAGSPAFTLSCLACLGFVSWLLAEVHGVIHTPGDRWMERQRWFMWLDRHHYIHHVDLTANMNFMLPLCDLLLGSEKRRLTPEEAAGHPRFEEAKPMAKDVVPPALSRAA